MKNIIILFLFVLLNNNTYAIKYDADKLFDTLHKKVLYVKDYTAQIKLKLNVTYMRIPQLGGTLYFKSPNKLRLERHGGLSILPKKNKTLTLNNLLPDGKVTVLDLNYAIVGGNQLRVLKIIPEDEQSSIILTKLWIDETQLLAVRTETTTRNDGTIVMDLEYGKFANYALPDKVTIFMDIKDYQLPKGVTMEYNENADTQPKKQLKNQKGTIQINYLSYDINKGINDAVFNQPD